LNADEVGHAAPFDEGDPRASLGLVSTSQQGRFAEMRLTRELGVAVHTVRAGELGLQEGENRKDTPVCVACDWKPELLEDAGHVFLDAAVGEEHAGCDRGVR